MPRFRNLVDHEVDSKSHARDVVTVADGTAEDTIRRDVATILLKAAVVGEQAVASLGDKC